MKDFNKAIELEENYPLLYANRANIYFKNGKYNNALADYTKALEIIDEGECEIIGGVVMQKKDIQGDLFEQTVDDTSICGESGRAVLLYNIGLTHENRKDLVDAENYYAQSIETNAEYAPAYYSHGILQLRKGEFDAALANFDKAVELVPDHASVYCIRGETLRVLEQPAQALEDFNKAIELNPEFGRAFFCRSLVYKEKGEMELAKQDFEASKGLKFKAKKHKLVLNISKEE